MDRTSRTHFGMDERGLGGTHMIQQQFLHMYRRIQTAEKLIDNEPPATGMFRRPTFSQFGDYWKRVQPVQYTIESKVDHAPPVSFPLLEGLYINQRRPPGASFETAHRANQRKHKSKRSHTLDLEHADVIEGVHVDGMPESMIAYLGSIHKRKLAVAEERDAIRRRRLLRHQEGATDDAMYHPPYGGGSNIHALARDTLFSLEQHARAAGGHGGPVDAEGHFDDPDILSVSPTIGEAYSSPLSGRGAMQEALMPMHSLVLKSPHEQHEPDALLQTRSSVRAASMRSKAASQSGVYSSKSEKEASEGAPPPMKKSISCLNPELLAASAPKKLVLRKPTSAASPSSGRAPRPGQTAVAASVSPRRSPRQVAAHVPAPPPPRRAIDSSMAGHQYAPICMPVLSAAASPIVLPSGHVQQIPPKVIGLMQRYDAGDDCAACDDHHIHSA
jgi:hypothetical protein